MKQDDFQKIFTRRALILGGMQGLLLTTLVGRLYHLQVLSKDHYQTLSDKNRLHTRLTAPVRGRIFDRHGTVLALNSHSYSLVIIRDQALEWEQKFDMIAKMLSLSSVEIEKIKHSIKSKPRFFPVMIKNHLTWEEVARLELRLVELTGFSIETGQTRYYPDPLETSHVIGYVAIPSDKEEGESELLNLPGFRVGKTGIEKYYDSNLRGQPGLKQVELNASRRIVRELATSESTPGENLRLSLDLTVQKSAIHLLQNQESAAAVVLDVHTGQIICFASTPSYDSNLFVQGISNDNWKNLLSHPRQPLVNKLITGQYSPGSIFKMIVALAALEEKIITQNTLVPCCGVTLLGTHKFHCHRKGGHGSVNLETALMVSCDAYFFHIASLIGIDAIAQMAKKFGLGEPTGIDLPGEKTGLVPSRSWKSLVMGRGWHKGETYNASIGQGYVLATPLQLAVMTAQLANGGKKISPLFNLDAVRPPLASLNINPFHLKVVQAGMEKAVNSPGGTSYQSRIITPGFEMAGKTGTTQVRRISEKDRKSGKTSTAERPWEQRDHALFSGYAPLRNPRFAAVVIVEHGVSGGKVAAPLGRDLLLLTQIAFKK